MPHHKGHWTTAGIYVQSYDPIEKILIFKTSNIGIERQQIKKKN